VSVVGACLETNPIASVHVLLGAGFCKKPALRRTASRRRWLCDDQRTPSRFFAATASASLESLRTSQLLTTRDPTWTRTNK